MLPLQHHRRSIREGSVRVGHRRACTGRCIVIPLLTSAPLLLASRAILCYLSQRLCKACHGQLPSSFIKVRRRYHEGCRPSNETSTTSDHAARDSECKKRKRIDGDREEGEGGSPPPKRKHRAPEVRTRVPLACPALQVITHESSRSLDAHFPVCSLAGVGLLRGNASSAMNSCPKPPSIWASEHAASTDQARWRCINPTRATWQT